MTGQLETPPSEGRSRSSEPPRGTFSTASARTTPIEYTRVERLWFRLETPIPLPRLPRPSPRKILASIPRLIPGRIKRSRFGEQARKHPAFTSWAAIFAAAVVVIVAQSFVEPHFRWEPERYQKWLARRGARAVKASLAEIGPSVTIPSVSARPAGEHLSGYFNAATGEITFNSSIEHHPFFLLDTAAHECVHGIFLQNGLTPPGSLDDDYFTLVNEVAAYVLGAHIVGTIMSNEGLDGSIATEALYLLYRRYCDPNNPDGGYSQYLSPDALSSGVFDHQQWRSSLVHFGAPLELVDAVHEICYLNTDPVEAARKISRRFMTRDLAPKDRPILEEFERTRARWNQVR